MRSPALSRAASILLALEGCAILIIAGIEVTRFGSGDVAAVPTAIALIALTLICAAALLVFALAVPRGQSWARSGGVVLHVLALALALASLTLTPIPWVFTAALGLPGIAGLGMLLALARSEGPLRVPGGDGDEAEESDAAPSA